MLKYFCLIIALVAAININGQYRTLHNDTLSVRLNYKKQLVKGTIVTSTAVALAFVLDKPVNTWMQGVSGSAKGGMSDVINAFGEKTIIIPALGVTWGLSHLIKNEHLKRSSWNAVKAVVVTAAATEAIKIAAGRARPFTGEGPHSFHPFDRADQYKSLPSGHSALAFAVFTPFAETYSRWIYAVPASVALVRVYENKHWFSDVVLGGGIGFISAWIFTHYPQKNIQVTGNSLVVCF